MSKQWLGRMRRCSDLWPTRCRGIEGWGWHAWPVNYGELVLPSYILSACDAMPVRSGLGGFAAQVRSVSGSISCAREVVR